MEGWGKKGARAGLLFIDLDNFKTNKARHGHALGDQVLQILAATANGVIRSTDFVGRLGGEEFAVVLHGAPRDSALAIAERIRSVFAERAAVIGGVQVDATVSIGLVLHEGPPV